jgi:hypothetical protein
MEGASVEIDDCGVEGSWCSELIRAGPSARSSACWISPRSTPRRCNSCVICSLFCRSLVSSLVQSPNSWSLPSMSSRGNALRCNPVFRRTPTRRLLLASIASCLLWEIRRLTALKPMTDIVSTLSGSCDILSVDARSWMLVSSRSPSFAVRTFDLSLLCPSGLLAHPHSLVL